MQCFFWALAAEEQEHAELLGLCREAATRSGWKEECFAPWREAVPRLEAQLQEAEASLEGLENLSDALRLVLRIETSEINAVFGSIVEATDSDFVAAIQAFQVSGTTHLSQLRREIVQLDPDLTELCQAMEA